jgi:SAM-dependent methyltransferase
MIQSTQRNLIYKLNQIIGVAIQTFRIFWESLIIHFYKPVIPRNKSLCKFLKSKTEIYHCTQYLNKHRYASHRLRCKDWDIANIIADLSDGNLLDMGSWDSYILKNAVIKGLRGDKYGIDLQKPAIEVNEVKYVLGDLLETDFPDSFFQNITCLSVIEHEINLNKFAYEVSRLLTERGKLYLTFDYWTPKVRTDFQIFGKEWNLFDSKDVLKLIEELQNKDLFLVQDVDWSLEKPVINSRYYSPDPKIGYTFGLLVFQKKKPKNGMARTEE